MADAMVASVVSFEPGVLGVDRLALVPVREGERRMGDPASFHRAGLSCGGCAVAGPDAVRVQKRSVLSVLLGWPDDEAQV